MTQVQVNLNRDWGEVGDIVTDATAGTKVRDAFWGGQAEKVLLSAGTWLYKFNGYNTLHGSDAAAQYRPVSPWWSPYHAFRHDPGWDAKKHLAASLGVSVREWGRITSAVKENWNSLEYLLVIVLKHDVYGFFGGFAQQARMDTGSTSKRVTTGNGVMAEGSGNTTNLAGGGTQFYIPNLRPTNISNWSTQSLLAY